MNERLMYTAFGMGIGATISLIGGRSLGDTAIKSMIFGSICYFTLVVSRYIYLRLFILL